VWVGVLITDELIEEGTFFETVLLDDQLDVMETFHRTVRGRLDNPLVYDEPVGNRYLRRAIQSARNDWLYARWTTVKGSNEWRVQTVGHPYKEIEGLVVVSSNKSRPANHEVLAAVTAAGGTPRTELPSLGD